MILDVQKVLHCRTSDSSVSEDAGIEPRTVATLALAVRRYIGSILLTTRLDLTHNSARSHPQLGKISPTTRLDLTHNSARSHPQLG